MTASVPKCVFPLESLDSAGGSIYVNFLLANIITRQEGTHDGLRFWLLCCGREGGEVLPGIESVPHLLPVS